MAPAAAPLPAFPAMPPTIVSLAAPRLNRDYSFLVAAFPAIWRHARNSGAELAEGPQMAPPSCRRWEHEGRSRHNSRREPARSVGFRPLSGRFGDRRPNPLTNPGAENAPRLSRHTPVLSSDLDATGSSAVMAVEEPVAGRQSGAGSHRTEVLGSQDVLCPLWVISRPFSTAVRMSAFGGKADVNQRLIKRPLIARSGHSAARPKSKFGCTENSL